MVKKLHLLSRVFGLIAGLIVKLKIRNLRAHFAFERFGAEQVLTSKFREFLNSQGYDFQKYLLVSEKKKKCIALVQHKDYGACVVKWICSPATLENQHQHVWALETAHSSPDLAACLPKLFHIDKEHSCEEYVGENLASEFDAANFSQDYFLNFISSLGAFGNSRLSCTLMVESDLDILVSKYLRRVVPELKLGWLFLGNSRADVNNHIAALKKFFRDKPVSQTNSIDDLHLDNLVYSASKEKIFLVDVEDINGGCISFDFAYLVFFLSAVPMAKAQVNTVINHIQRQLDESNLYIFNHICLVFLKLKLTSRLTKQEKKNVELFAFEVQKSMPDAS